MANGLERVMEDNTGSGLLQRLHELFEMQREGAFILTSVFLDDAEISMIKLDLSQDRLRHGAIGRYEGILVRKRDCLLRVTASGDLRVGCHRGISYIYVKMAIVD